MTCSIYSQYHSLVDEVSRYSFSFVCLLNNAFVMDFIFSGVVCFLVLFSDGQSVPALSTTRGEESRGRESSGQASWQDTSQYDSINIHKHLDLFRKPVKYYI